VDGKAADVLWIRERRVPEGKREGTNLVEKRIHLLLVAWKAVEEEDPGTPSPLLGDLRLDQGCQGGA